MHDVDYWKDVVNRLRELPQETEWVEFKRDNTNPEAIGEYISALSNSATLTREAEAYIVWGVEDETHSLVGTTFDPASTKVGNENLENWLLRNLRPQIHFSFHIVDIDDVRAVVLRIACASTHPIRFRDEEYIRVGSYKKRLRDHPEHAKRLWRAIDDQAFEVERAATNIEADDVLKLLHYPSYFDLLDFPLPENRRGILDRLEADRLIVPSSTGRWDITNLGAILFARSLDTFPSLMRKRVRIVQYPSKSRIDALREKEMPGGYATEFAGLVGHILDLLPSNEVIRQAVREEVPAYPELVVRELVANALIHQDFSLTGAGPIIEIFDSRLEITSPGLPLVMPNRFVDAPPQSRNEQLASMMRRLRICEERGSGWDKVAFEIEYHQLPAPLIETAESQTRIILFSSKALRSMDREDRVRAVYLHACLRYVNREYTTNSSVRERFGIPKKNSAMASRIIADAVEAGVIVLYDPTAAPKLRRYVPEWADVAGSRLA